MAESEVTVSEAPATAPKGRPTPSRKDAEAARKAELTGKAKPGASKKETREAERAAATKQRAIAREGMLRGDDKYLPPRDQGPVKKYVRDFVDSRRTIAEFFVPIAVVVLVCSLVPNQTLKGFIVLVWMLILALTVMETTWWMLKMNGELKAKFPDKADRKGVVFYAIMRALQIRRLRLPPARFKAGGRPVPPKSS